MKAYLVVKERILGGGNTAAMPQAAGTLQEAEAHAPPGKASKLDEEKANFVARIEPVE